MLTIVKQHNTKKHEKCASILTVQKTEIFKISTSSLKCRIVNFEEGVFFAMMRK